jgi:hypothetical protein
MSLAQWGGLTETIGAVRLLFYAGAIRVPQNAEPRSTGAAPAVDPDRPGTMMAPFPQQGSMGEGIVCIGMEPVSFVRRLLGGHLGTRTHVGDVQGPALGRYKEPVRV